MTPWAVVIGIDLHPDDADLNPLKGAVADAIDFAEWLLAPDGGKVAPENLFFWTHPEPKAAAGPLLSEYLQAETLWPQLRKPKVFKKPDMTRAPKTGEVMGMVAHLQKHAATSRRNGDRSRCYVHLAGHGVDIKNETCFLLGDYADSLGMISADQMHAALQSAGFDEVLMFLDCCRTHPGPGLKLPDLFQVTDTRSVLGLGRAAEAGYQSFEYPLDAPTRGAFTHALTQGLRGHRVAGRLSFKELGEFVKERVPHLVAPHLQRPQFFPVPDEPPIPLVLVEGQATPAISDIVFTFVSGAPGTTYDLRDATGQRFGSPIPSGATPVRVSAPPGLYAIGPKLFAHTGPGDTHVSV